jgi:hypothetical protein
LEHAQIQIQTPRTSRRNLRTPSQDGGLERCGAVDGHNQGKPGHRLQQLQEEGVRCLVIWRVEWGNPRDSLQATRQRPVLSYLSAYPKGQMPAFQPTSPCGQHFSGSAACTGRPDVPGLLTTSQPSSDSRPSDNLEMRHEPRELARPQQSVNTQHVHPRRQGQTPPQSPTVGSNCDKRNRWSYLSAFGDGANSPYVPGHDTRWIAGRVE